MSPTGHAYATLLLPATRPAPLFDKLTCQRIVGAIALAIVLAVGGSTAIAGFLTDWGRYGHFDSGSRRPPSQARPDRGLQRHDRAELVVTDQPWK